MIRLYTNKLDTNVSIYLPETWHEKLLNNMKVSTYPYEFTYVETVDEDVHIFKSTKNKYVALSDVVIKYLLGSEVPDNNIGFSFKEFLPNENTDMLITSLTNGTNVIPVTLCISEEMVTSRTYGKIPMFDFHICYLNKNGFEFLSELMRKKVEWKFLFSNDNSYMSDFEKMYQDTFIHKKYVMASCKKLANYLKEQGITEHAEMLMERAKIHDNSKVECEDETRALSMIINDKSCLNDANKALSQIKTDALKLHWKHNTHHPEHFKNFADMSKLDIMEMCCDWHARSSQYKTDLMEFLEVRQRDRFHFPDYMYAEIKFYCEILVR